MTERAAVYRLYDDGGELLYVGVADKIGRRWDQHARSQQWWPDVSRQTVEWHPDRDVALLAEEAAIKAECPKYNVMHTPRARGPRERVFGPLPEGASAEFVGLRQLVLEKADLDAEINATLEELLRAGEYVEDIANALGESREKVRQFRKAHGISDARDIRREKGTPRRRPAP